MKFKKQILSLLLVLGGMPFTAFGMSAFIRGTKQLATVSTVAAGFATLDEAIDNTSFVSVIRHSFIEHVNLLPIEYPHSAEWLQKIAHEQEIDTKKVLFDVCPPKRPGAYFEHTGKNKGIVSLPRSTFIELEANLQREKGSIRGYPHLTERDGARNAGEHIDLVESIVCHELQHSKQPKEWTVTFCRSLIGLTLPKIVFTTFCPRMALLKTIVGIGAFIQTDKVVAKYMEYDADVNSSQKSEVLKALARSFKALNTLAIDYDISSLGKDIPEDTIASNSLREIAYFLVNSDNHPHYLTRAYCLEHKADELEAEQVKQK